MQARENWGGQTALMWAAAQSQPEMIQLLLKHGARVDERSTVRDWQRRVTAEGRPKDMYRGGLTPLLFAAREGCVDCLKVLLEKGADIDLPDPDGATALIMALLNYHWDAGRFLHRGRRRREPVGYLRPDAAVRGGGHEYAARGPAHRAAIDGSSTPVRTSCACCWNAAPIPTRS